jgi:hypothetical protein
MSITIIRSGEMSGHVYNAIRVILVQVHVSAFCSVYVECCDAAPVQVQVLYNTALIPVLLYYTACRVEINIKIKFTVFADTVPSLPCLPACLANLSY